MTQNTQLPHEFQELLKCFHNRGVRYLLLGGYAVGFHGYPRPTEDIDLWLAIDPANAEKVSLALRDFGISADDVPPGMFLEQRMVFRFGRKPIQVELLTSPSGVDFETCWADRVETELARVPVNVISLWHLRHLGQNKLASGRHKDLADLEELPPAP